MANPQNLKTPTPSEARERGRKGGIASGRSRLRKKHGKDLSKADVSVNIFAHLEAQRLGHPVELHCAIGDTEVDGVPYAVIVETAREYINNLGGFEKFAEWGLLRP